MMCQEITNAVSYMYHTLGYSCTNYIDDFGGQILLTFPPKLS